ECVFRTIDDEALAVVVADDHPLVGKRRVEFAALCAFSWVLQPHGSPMRDLIDHEFRDHHAPLPKGLIETGSILTTINLIRGSQLIGVIPDAVAQQYAAHDVLRVLPYRFRQKLEAYGSVVRSDRPLSKPAQEFLALLHAPRNKAVAPARRRR
ncbi:MAG TPA: LysR substrate-binding domain-containing protein, partial [Hyphomicrobiaceae bacterium]|nr:LysR substrate-binding domain-containing protein [Hyphomicrobiaceae bacterium]